MVITIVVLIAITFIGLIRFFRNLTGLTNRINYVEECTQKLIDLVDSITTNPMQFILQNSQEYAWLLDNQYKIQMELGVDGTVFFRDPLKGIVDRNHQIIPNFLLEIPQFIRQFQESLLYINSFTREDFMRKAEMCVNVLSIHNGRLSESHEQLWKNRFNVLFFFSEGIKIILSIPWLILKSFGLLNERNYVKVTTSKVFGLFSALAALIGLVSSIIGIVLGWSEFLSWFKNLFVG